MPTSSEKPITGPRRWLEKGKSFTKGEAAWRTGDTLREKAQIAAAQRQYRVATAVRVELARSGKGVADLGKEVGLSVHQLRRMLRGEANMPLDVAEAVVRAVGFKTTFGIKRVEDDADE